MQTNSSESEHESFRKEYLALATRFRAASDIHVALSVILETEQLFRARGQVGFGSASFNAEMGILLARHSEICALLRDTASASSLMDEALQYLQGCPIAIDFALLTPQAILKFIRNSDARTGTKWRQREPLA